MCLDSHGDCPGPVFQIRKYMYQTCVHVEDIAPLHDVTGIQAYLINSKRALLIHSKISALASANSALDEICRGCQRPLRSDCQYCSLHCKNVANSNRDRASSLHGSHHRPHALQPWTVRGGFQPRRSQELDPQQEDEAGFMSAPRQY
ncbi:hypothetical protein F751_4846 [Auxenochlorella protothecoides]|uniref:Uncharacterized protein n=2 Tax=Auxenochlorella protothecoides TaxID=3075 RepID=A0A087SKU9_AUXPR|nr:hypothetical protein F751_4846 [Auxenochlorella protothecoides]KFM26353.1 hypothetical protein F751_4846 [Auxenochlorella protothecoides]